MGVIILRPCGAVLATEGEFGTFLASCQRKLLGTESFRHADGGTFGHDKHVGWFTGHSNVSGRPCKVRVEWDDGSAA